MHSARPRRHVFNYVVAYTVHTYRLFVHVYVYCVARSHNRTVSVHSLIMWGGHHVPSVYTVFGRVTFRGRPVYVGGGGDKRREERGPVLPRAKERKRGETICICERNANDNDDTQSSQNTIIKFDTDAYTFACGLAPIIQVHTITYTA